MHVTDPEFAAMVSRLLNEVERDGAAKNPRLYRKARVMSGSPSYHYTRSLRDQRGRRMWFCWSVHRNVAGYFLGWREVAYKSGTVKRDRWVSRKTRKAAQAVAVRRTAAFERTQGLRDSG